MEKVTCIASSQAIQALILKKGIHILCENMAKEGNKDVEEKRKFSP